MKRVLPLTTRQIEIVRLVADERSNLQIALLLGISISTVKNILGDAKNRLEIYSRVGLARYAIRKRLIQP